MKTLWLYFCLVVGLLLAAWCVAPPQPEPAGAPTDQFSAERAFADIAHMAAKPHPVGSAEHERVKAYLLARLTRMGLSPKVFSQVAVSQGWKDFARAAPISDLVAVLPGRDPHKPALLIMSHYDSAPLSPGAADDAAGVATALEIARALQVGPKPERDVVFLLTDGEELGLLGAEAFFRHHPLAPHIGAVLNFEARGGSGLTAMFETGPNNGGLIDRFAAVAEHPSATSLSDAIYARMPNGTDFSVAKARGLMGLNFAFIGSEEFYHTSIAVPWRIDLGSVQQMGDQALPIARDLALRPELPAQDAPSVYFDLFGWTLIHYPPYVGWGLIALAVFLISFLFNSGRASDGWAVFRSTLGCGLIVLMPASALWSVGHGMAGWDHFQRVSQHPLLLAAGVLLTIALATLSAQVLRTGRGRPMLSILTLLFALLANLGGLDVVALAMAGGALLLIWTAVGRPLETADVWRGSLMFGLLVGAGVQLLAPAAAALILWPLLLSILAGCVVFGLNGRPEQIAALALCGGLAIVSTAQFGALENFLFDAVGVDFPVVTALPLLPLLPVWAPLLAAAGGERSTAEMSFLMLAAGVAVLGVARFADPFAARPMPSAVMHVQNLDTAEASRVAPFAHLDSWAKSALEADGMTVVRAPLPGAFETPVWATKTVPSHRLPQPKLKIAQKDGRLIVTAQGNPGDVALMVTLRSSKRLQNSYLNGQPLGGSLAADAPQSIVLYAPDKAGAVWTFAAPAHARVTVQLKEMRSSWPEDVAPLPWTPPNIMAFGPSGSSIGIVTRKRVW